MQEQHQALLRDNASLAGRLLYGADRIAHNLKFYIKRHVVSIEVFFLIAYSLLNLGLAYFVRGTAISLFIIIFLLLIGMERLIIHLKSKLDKESLDKREAKIKTELQEQYSGMDEYTSQLEMENTALRCKNQELRRILKHQG